MGIYSTYAWADKNEHINKKGNQKIKVAFGENKGINPFPPRCFLMEVRKVQQIKFSFFIALLKWSKGRR